MEATLTALADSAQSAYDAGQFEKAASLFLQLESQGADPSSVAFNLGNCYTRLEEWGQARLYFERAALLRPSDDARYNLEWVRQRLTDELPDPAPELYELVSNGLRSINAFDWMLQTGVAIVALTVVWLVLRKLYVPLRGLHWRWPLTTTVIGAVLLAAHLIAQPSSDRAVLTATNSYGYSEPSKASTTLLMLSEGSTGRIRKSEDDWYYLELGNGERAWFDRSQWVAVYQP